MTHLNMARLLLLSAIWGASYLLIRLAVPVLGPIWTVEGRVLCGALFLLLIALGKGVTGLHLKDLPHHLIMGGLNIALPFVLIAWAAQSLTPGLLSILIATSPCWAAVFNALGAGKRLSLPEVTGLVSGVFGVGVLVGYDASIQQGSLLAVLATLGAACSYACATCYAQRAPVVPPFANAQGSLWAATLLVALPALALPWPQPTTASLLSIAALGIVCSGIAYLLYFRLLKEVGAVSTLTVTFLVPVFSILWGLVLQGEIPGWNVVLGCALVSAATLGVTGYRPGKTSAPR